MPYHRPFATAVVGLAFMALAACASDTPRLDSDYRSSVRMMVLSQTHDLAAETEPLPTAPDRGDGPYLEAVMEVYRTDVSRGTPEVTRDVVISVGN